LLRIVLRKIGKEIAQMGFYKIFIVVGVIVALTGLAIAIFSFIFLKKNKLSSIITGVFFFVVGSLITWFSFNPDKTINLGMSDKMVNFLIPFLVLCMFIYKAVTIFQEGNEELKVENRPAYLMYRSRRKIASAVLMLIFYILILPALFSLLWKK
jgi:hypothetical protein